MVRYVSGLVSDVNKVVGNEDLEEEKDGGNGRNARHSLQERAC